MPFSDRLRIIGIVKVSHKRLTAIIGNVVSAPVLVIEVIQCSSWIEVIPLLPIVPFMSFKCKLNFLLQENVSIGNRRFWCNTRTLSYSIVIMQCISIRRRWIVAQDSVGI